MAISDETWVEVFRYFRPVDNVHIDSANEQFEIIVNGRHDTLIVTRKELDEAINVADFQYSPTAVAAEFLRKHGATLVYQDTLVGFFDIMAYSKLIKQFSIEECVQKLSRLFDVTRPGTNFLGVKLDRWILSDSIIVVVDTIRSPLFGGSLNSFLITCSYLMRSAMFENIPLRGAIGGGDFYKDGDIMVSSALVDAVRYEKKQDWLGAVITPTAIEKIKKAKEFDVRHKLDGQIISDLSSDTFKPFVEYGAIPWKRDVDEDTSMYYLKYRSPYLHWEDGLPVYFDKEKKKTLIENTDRFYREIQE